MAPRPTARNAQSRTIDVTTQSGNVRNPPMRMIRRNASSPKRLTAVCNQAARAAGAVGMRVGVANQCRTRWRAAAFTSSNAPAHPRRLQDREAFGSGPRATQHVGPPLRDRQSARCPRSPSGTRDRPRAPRSQTHGGGDWETARCRASAGLSSRVRRKRRRGYFAEQFFEGRGAGQAARPDWRRRDGSPPSRRRGRVRRGDEVARGPSRPAR